MSVCARHGYAHTPQHETPSLPRRPRLPAALDLDKIKSPVGCYIKNHPVPPLLRCVRPAIAVPLLHCCIAARASSLAANSLAVVNCLTLEPL